MRTYFLSFVKDNFSWCSVEGRRLQLTDTPLSALSEPECIALQRVAQTRLKQLDFKSHLTIPKGTSGTIILTTISLLSIYFLIYLNGSRTCLIPVFSIFFSRDKRTGKCAKQSHQLETYYRPFRSRAAYC